MVQGSGAWALPSGALTAVHAFVSFDAKHLGSSGLGLGFGV